MSSLRFILDNFLGHEKMSYGPPAPFASPMQHISPTAQQLPPAVPWLLIEENEVRSSSNNMPLFQINRSAAPGSWTSSRSLITLIRVSNGSILGTARLRSSSDSIELTINGVASKLKDETLMSIKYSFYPATFPPAKWYWKQTSEGLNLTDGQDGRVIATVRGGTLVCENIGLSETIVDEVVLSAVAMLAKLKRTSKQGEAAEGIGEVVGALAGS